MIADALEINLIFENLKQKRSRKFDFLAVR